MKNSIAAGMTGSKHTAFYLPDDIMRTAVHVTCGISIAVALTSAIAHYYMGIGWISIVGLIQLALCVSFWIFGLKTQRFRLAFQLALAADYVGISTSAVLGGELFLTNIFWLALFPPLYIISGSARVGYTFFTILIVQILGLYWRISPDPVSVPAVILTEGLLFASAMLVFVVNLKRWQDRLQIKAVDAENETKRIKDNKIRHLVTISHELRTPISTLASAIQILKAELETDSEVCSPNKTEPAEKQTFLIETIHNTSNHVLEVLNEVLDTERMEAGFESRIKKRFRVRRLVREVLDSFAIPASVAGASLKLRIAKGVRDEWIGPEKQIRQVLINLVSNALHHAKGAVISISVLVDNDRLIFQVADNGHGMPEHVLKKLFEPFASSSGVDGTSGLGLGICKMLLEDQIGGSISVHSEVGVGTTFTVSVPVVASSDDNSQQVIDETTKRHRTHEVTVKSASKVREKRLLLVEDDDSYRQILALGLSKAGLTVECAKTSQNAMELIRSREGFDFVLIDYNLGPDSVKDGIELIADMSDVKFEKVVGYTGNYSDTLEMRWIQAGAHCVVSKPILVPELISLFDGSTE